MNKKGIKRIIIALVIMLSLFFITDKAYAYSIKYYIGGTEITGLNPSSYDSNSSNVSLPNNSDTTIKSYMRSNYDDKVILGWYDNSSYTGTRYTDIDSLKSLNRNVNLYAKVVDERITITYHYKNDDWEDSIYIESFYRNDDGIYTSFYPKSIKDYVSVSKDLIIYSERGTRIVEGILDYGFGPDITMPDGNTYIGYYDANRNVYVRDGSTQHVLEDDLILYAEYVNIGSYAYGRFPELSGCYNIENKICLGWSTTQNSDTVEFNYSKYNNFAYGDHLSDILTAQSEPVDITFYPVYEDKESYSYNVELEDRFNYTKENIQRGTLVTLPSYNELEDCPYGHFCGGPWRRYNSSFYSNEFTTWRPTVTAYLNDGTSNTETLNLLGNTISHGVQFFELIPTTGWTYEDEVGDSQYYEYGATVPFDAYVDLKLSLSTSDYTQSKRGLYPSSNYYYENPIFYLYLEGFEPEREGYDFLGWYDAPEGGNLLNSETTQNLYFTNEEAQELAQIHYNYIQNSVRSDSTFIDNIDIYAHWAKKQVTITNTSTNEVSVVDYGSTYTFGEIDDYQIYPGFEVDYVYFEYLDGHTETKNIDMGRIRNGWKDTNNNHYDNNQSITVTEDLTISYDEHSGYIYPTFPELPEGYFWVDENNVIKFSHKSNTGATYYEHIDDFEYDLIFAADSSDPEWQIDYDTATYSKTGLHTGDTFTTPLYSDMTDDICFSGCWNSKKNYVPLILSLKSSSEWKPVVKAYYNNGTEEYTETPYAYSLLYNAIGYRIKANDTTYDLEFGQTYTFIYNTNVYELPVVTPDDYGYHYDSTRVNLNKRRELLGTYIEVGQLPRIPQESIPEGYEFVGWYDAPEGGTRITNESSLNRYLSLEKGVAINNKIAANADPNGNATSSITLTSEEGYGDPIELYAHYVKKQITVTHYNNGINLAPMVTVHDYGDTYNVGPNPISVINPGTENKGAITFNFDDGTTEIRYVVNETRFDGWISNTKPDINDPEGTINIIPENGNITLTEDLYIEPSLVTSNWSPEFPTAKEGYAWFDSNGIKYTSYDGDEDITLYELEDGDTYKLIFALDTNDDNSLIENPSYSYTNIHNGQTFTTPTASDYSTGFCRNPLDCQKNIHTYFPIEYFISNDNEWRPTAVLHYMDENDTTITSTTGNIWSDTEMFWIDGLKTGYTISYDDFTQDLDLNSSYTFNYGRDITDVVINGMTKNMSARIVPNGLALRIPVTLNPNGNSNQVEHPGVPQGYLFDGWYTEPNGQGTKYDNMDNPTGGIETFRFRLMSNDDVAYLFNNVSGWKTDDYQMIGTKLSNYEGFEPIHLYANYVPQQFNVTTYYNVNETPDIQVYNYGETHTFGVNDSTYPEGNSVAAVTFMYADNTSEVRYVVYEERADGWIGSEEPDILTGSNIRFFADNETITVTNDLFVMRHSLESNYSPEFPTPREGYAWFDSNGTKYTSYDGDEDITLYEQEDSETYSLIFRVDLDNNDQLIDNPKYSSTNIRNGQTFTTPSTDDYGNEFCRSQFYCMNQLHTYTELDQFISSDNEWHPALVLHYMDDENTIVTNPQDSNFPAFGNFYIDILKTGYKISYDNFEQELDFDTTYTFNYGRDIDEAHDTGGNFYGRSMKIKGEAAGVVVYIPDSYYFNGTNSNTPTKEGYRFEGWYTEPNGQGTKFSQLTQVMSAEDAAYILDNTLGWEIDDWHLFDEKLSNYEGFEPIHLYANFVKRQSIITYMYSTPETVLVDLGDTHVLRENNVQKASENAATITFTGVGDRYVRRDYYTDGWLIDGVYYRSGSNLLATDMYYDVYPNYRTQLFSPEFPTPTGDGTFVGWYTEPNGQGERITEYNLPEDITLYPYFENTSNNEHIVIIDNEYIGIYQNGETIDIPHYTYDDGLMQVSLLRLMSKGSLYDTRAIMGYYHFDELKLNDSSLDEIYMMCMNESSCSYTISSSDDRVMSFKNRYSYETQSVTLPIPEDTVDEHFEGWYTDSVAGDKMPLLYGAGGEFVTLYAHWSPIDNTKSVVTYEDGFVEIYDIGDTLNDRGLLVEHPNYERIFYDYNDGTDRYEEVQYDRLCNIGTYNLYRDTYYSDSIGTYNSANEIVLNDPFVYITINYDYNSCVSNPSELMVPTPENDKVFLGWYTELNGGERVNTLSEALDNYHYNLYGLWKNDGEVAITYEDGSIEIVPVGTVKTVPSVETYTYTNYWSFNSLYPSETVSIYEMDYGYNAEDYRLSPVRTITTTKWTINNVDYNPGSNITINEDTYINRDKTTVFDVEGFHTLEPRSGDENNYTFGAWLTGRHDSGEYIDDYIYNSKERILQDYCYDNECIEREFYGYWLRESDNTHIVMFDDYHARTYMDGEELYLDGNSYSRTIGTLNEYVDGSIYSFKDIEAYYTLDSYTLNGETNYNSNQYLTIESTHPKIMRFTSNYSDAQYNRVYLDSIDKNGYNFIGWFTEDNGEGTKYDSYYTPNGDTEVNLYAYFEEKPLNTYTVYYYDKDYNVVDQFGVTEGTTITLANNENEYDNYMNTEGKAIFDTGFEKLERYVYRYEEPDGWRIDGNHYADGASYTVNGNTWIYPTSTMRNRSVTAPTIDDPRFIGWFTEVEGGEEFTSFAGDNTAYFYAHYSGDPDEMVNLIYPDGTWTVPKGNVSLRENTLERDNEVVATVTFDYDDGVTPSEVRNVEKIFAPAGWIIDGQSYWNGQNIYVDEDIVIEANYNFDYSTDGWVYPTPEDKVFVGWYDDHNGEGTLYTEYKQPQSIVLYAYFIELEDDEHAYYINNQYKGIVKDGEAMAVPYYNGDYIKTGTLTLKNGNETAYTIDITSYVDTMDIYVYGDDFNSFNDYDSLDNENHLAYYNINSSYPKKIYVITNEMRFANEINLSNYNLPNSSQGEFSGWYSEPNGEGTRYNSYYGSNDITLYAYFIERTYNIYYYDNYGDIFHSEEANYGETITLLDNEFIGNSHHSGSVTFDSGDNKEQIMVNVTETGNGWEDDEGTHYNNSATYTVTGTTYFYPSYVDVEQPVIAPNNNNPNFIGWFSEVEGGEEYTPYGGSEDITVYAHYSGDTVALIYPDGTWNVPRGMTVSLRRNQIPKESENGAIITFVGTDVRYVTKEYVPVGWIINDEDYNNDDLYIANEDTTILSRYAIRYISPEFPVADGNENQVFDGWYTEENGNGTRYTSYNGTENLTLYPNFITLADDEHVYYIDNEYMGIIRDGEDINLPFYWDSYQKYGTVTLMNGDEVYDEVDIYGYVTIHYYNLNGNSYIYEWDIPYTVYSSMPKVLNFTSYKHWDVDNIDLGEYTPSGNGDQLFIGWYDDPTNGNRVYDANKTITVYARWQTLDPTKSYVFYSDGTSEVYDRGDTLNRYHDKTFFDTMYYHYNDGTGREDEVDYTITCPPNRYYVNTNGTFDEDTATMYQSNEEIILTEPVYYISVGEQLLKYCNYEPSELLEPEPDGNKTFIGWYSTENGGTKVERPTTENNIVYGQWKEANDVVITYEDGTLEIVPAGTVKTVPTTEYITLNSYVNFITLYPTEETWEFFESREYGYDENDYQVEIKTKVDTNNWDVEGTTYNPGESFTVNENIFVNRDKE